MQIKSAPEILTASLQHMTDRAMLRDSPEGERSMAKCVKAFNALEGTDLTETQGWRFMAVLKHARATQGRLSLDDYEDAAAYWALAGESAQSVQDQGDVESHPSVSTRWVPQIGELYYYLSNTGVVNSRQWQSTPQEQKRWDAGHVFKSFKEAFERSDHTQSYILHENDPVGYPKVGDDVYLIQKVLTLYGSSWVVHPNVYRVVIGGKQDGFGCKIPVDAALDCHKEGHLFHSREHAEAKAKWENLK